MNTVTDLNEVQEVGTYSFEPGNNIHQSLSHVQWISVKDHLPKDIRACWVRTKDGIPPAWFFYNLKDECFEILAPCEIRFTLDYVTHWSPV
jgi:hypothetical protein